MSASFLKSAKLSDEHLSLALSQVKLGFWELDIQTGQITCTTQNRINFGFNLDQNITEQDINEAILPEDRKRRRAAIDLAMNPEVGTYNFEVRVRLPDSRIRWLEARGTIIFRDQRPVRIIGTTLDITEKKDMETLRDEILSIANHEVKTPLSAVKGYVQLLKRYVVGTGDVKHSAIAEKALASSEKIERILNEALDVNSHKVTEMALRKERVNIEELTREVSDSATTINADHTINIIVSKDIPDILADRHRIGQVITNLMNNAIKFSAGKNLIEVLIDYTQGHVRVAIRDYGMGISETEHDKIFEKFYRINTDENAVHGTGIGLYLCSEIITRHGGKIGLEKLPSNQGSCFYFTLPLK